MFKAVSIISLKDALQLLYEHKQTDDVYVLSHSHLFTEGTAYYLLRRRPPLYTLQNTLLNLYVSKSSDKKPLFESLLELCFKYNEKLKISKSVKEDIRKMYKYIDLICDTLYMLQNEERVKWWNPHLFTKELINMSQCKDISLDDRYQESLSKY